MKKIAIVLALMLVLSSFSLVACGNKDESSAAESAESKTAEESKEESVEASEAESSEESAEESEEESSEDEVSQSEADPKGTNVAKGCSYTGVQPSGAGKYTANLTDGVVAEKGDYTSDWFGFYWQDKDTNGYNNCTNAVGTLVIDLGKECDVNTVRAYVWNAEASGIMPAKSISAYVSTDNKTFTKVCNLPIPEQKDAAWAEASFEPATARYVKIEVAVQGCWTFMNEIEVYA